MSETPQDPTQGDTQASKAVDDLLSKGTSAEVANSSEAAEAPAADVEQRLAEANDRALRYQAELDNYRKRVQREMAEERRYAALPLLRSLLGVLDNLDRAIQSAEQGNDTAGLLDGVKMVSTQLAGILSEYHCKPIAALGVEFDPMLHEAVAQQPSDEHPAGKVTMVAVEGYTLHDRVIRPAQVMVSTGPAGTDPAE